jgi:hypothetical protein
VGLVAHLLSPSPPSAIALWREYLGGLDGKADADGKGSQQVASHHASAFAFEILAKFQPEARSGGEAKTHYNIAGDYVAGDKVMGDKVEGDKINNANIADGQGSVAADAVNNSIIVTGNNNVIGIVPNNTLDREDRLSNQHKSPAELEKIALQNEYARLNSKYELLNEQIAGEMNEDNKETLRTRRDSIKKQMDKIWNQLQ